MRIVGLTGGIASGKTTVSAMLRELGAHVIDADALAREVVEPGTLALKEIGQRFPGTVDAAGRLDRNALADRVFNNESELAALNAIVHPRVREAFAAKVSDLAAQGIDLVLYDVPLLFETKLQQQVDGVILVTAKPEVQLARLLARSRLSREQALARIRAQIPLSEKEKQADWLIENSGDIASTRQQVNAVWNSIRSLPRKRGVD
jgi:dephospho-CoA kinase